MSKRTVIAIVTTVIVIALGIGIWSTQKQPQKYTGPIEKITLGVESGDIDTLVWIAEDQGYFTDNSLDVTIKEYRAGKLSVDALVAGEVDIATAAEFVFVSNSFDQGDLRVLGTLLEANVHEVIARRDHGINQPSDLKGKKIGVTRKSGAEFTLGVFLTFNNISLQDVEIINLNPPQLVEAILKGEVDAINTWEPNAYEIKRRLGAVAKGWPPQGHQSLYWLLIGKESLIKEKPAVVERFLRAMVQAEEFVETNRAEAQKIVVLRTKLKQSYVEYIWPRLTFGVALDQVLLLTMEDEARWRIGNKLTDATEIPNYLDYVYTDALEAVKPNAMTIIN